MKEETISWRCFYGSACRTCISYDGRSLWPSMLSPIPQSPKSLLSLYLAIQVLLFIIVQGKWGKVMIDVTYITMKMGGGENDDDGCEDFKMWVLFILCSSSDQKAGRSRESLLWKRQHHCFVHSNISLSGFSCHTVPFFETPNTHKDSSGKTSIKSPVE